MRYVSQTTATRERRKKQPQHKTERQQMKCEKEEKRDWLNYLVMNRILCRGREAKKAATTTPLLSATKIYEVPGFVVDQMMHEESTVTRASARTSSRNRYVI